MRPHRYSTLPLPPGRTLLVRGASALVGVLLVLAPAMGSWSQSHGLDHVDGAQSRSLDDVDGATAGNSDDRTVDSVSLDRVPAARSEARDGVETIAGTSLDDASLAEAGAPDDADLAWRPTPCSIRDLASVDVPTGSDDSAWRAHLDASRERMATEKRVLQTVTEAFGASLSRGQQLRAKRVELGTQRDEARARYSAARCEMKGSLQAARRAGLLPGVVRDYETDDLTN